MSWIKQAKLFFSEVKEIKSHGNTEEKFPETDLEFVSAASEARLLKVPQGASFLIALSFFTIMGIVIWALMMSVDEVAKSQGKVIPSSRTQTIQNLSGGRLQKLNVVEGQQVKTGEILAIIDDKVARTESESGQNDMMALMARIDRLDAEAHDAMRILFSPALKGQTKYTQHEQNLFDQRKKHLQNQIDAVEYKRLNAKEELAAARSAFYTNQQNYNLAKKEMALNLPLVEKGAISKVDFLKIEQSVNNSFAKLDAAKSEIAKAIDLLHQVENEKETVISDFKSKVLEERVVIEAKLSQLEAKNVASQDKVDHSVIYSPVNGTVKQIYENTIGGIIKPGEPIIDIVPSDDKLLIEVQIKPKDIGFIAVGQKAKVKVTAFDFSTYGGLEGDVSFISADTITDQKGRSFYIARINTKKNYLEGKHGDKHTIIPGMTTQVDIVVNKKSIFMYILKPILK